MAADGMKFGLRMKDFFGLKPGEDLKGFLEELKALTPEDRAWFIAEFDKAGLPTVA